MKEKKKDESDGSDRFLPTLSNSSVSTSQVSCVYYSRQYYVLGRRQKEVSSTSKKNKEAREKCHSCCVLHTNIWEVMSVVSRVKGDGECCSSDG